MKIHHLNCGTLCPWGGSWLSGHDEMICHCLLIESGDGLILVDTGLGRADVQLAPGRLEKSFVRAMRPKLSMEETAIRQIEKLGFRAGDVRHIVLTHLDVDHAGALSDFPEAQVHVHLSELEAAQAPTSLTEKRRYRSAQWAHSPRWKTYLEDGESWKGFQAVRALSDRGSEVLLVPLVGHTRGHCAVAVRSSSGWLLHAGDAYFAKTEVHSEGKTKAPSCPPMLSAFQRLMAELPSERLKNRSRLIELARTHSDVRIFCAHDPEEFQRQVTAASAAR